jgi:hypothetical protein
VAAVVVDLSDPLMKEEEEDKNVKTESFDDSLLWFFSRNSNNLSCYALLLALLLC